MKKILLIFMLLIVRLTYIMIYKSKDYKQLAQDQWNSQETVYAKRGNITDRNGSILATSIDVYRVDLDLNAIDSYIEEDTVQTSDESDMGFTISPAKVREAVYETILSIDGLAAAATDNASPFDFIKDPSAMPDEKAEIIEMSRLVKQAIATLPQKERTVVEYRFYRNMQAKDIATMVGLSPSRITRIIQFSLNQIREYLKSRGREDY